jgi:hypothetical protein
MAAASFRPQILAGFVSCLASILLSCQPVRRTLMNSGNAAASLSIAPENPLPVEARGILTVAMAVEDKDKVIRELTERLKLREQELEIAERLPRVPPFVKAHSTTWINEGASQQTSWISCLPLEKFPLDRCCELLDVLAELHLESTESIFNIRARSLYLCLDCQTERDLEDFAYVVEFLQLPKQLKVKLDRKVAVDAFLSEGAPASDLVKNPLLRPLWNEDVERLNLKSYTGRELSLKERVQNSPFVWEGLLRTPAHAICAGFDPAAYALYLAGLVLGGHAPDHTKLPKPWIPAAGTILNFESECYLPLEAAAYDAPLSVLQGLLFAGWPWGKFAALTAATVDRVPVLSWALERKLPLPNDAYHYAARAGSTEAIKWLHGTAQLRISTRSCTWAAQYGQLRTLQLLRALGAHWWSSTCAGAAARNQLTVLEWLRAQTPPCPWDESVCTAAAASGHLATLKWLRGQAPPCPWQASACTAAAKHGHLATLQWLRAQEPPCPWSKDVVEQAKTAGIREWALANGCPAPAAAPVPPA